MVISVLIILSCGGPVGGYQIQVTLNGEKVVIPNARIYVEKVDLFERDDGTLGYNVLDSNSAEFNYLLFTLIGGEKGKPSQLAMTWLAKASDISEVAGRNFPAYSMKMFPPLEGYSNIAPTTEYMASYNDQTCYIVITLTKVDLEKKWINGVFNNIYVEKVENSWRRMELREGRFGAVFNFASQAGAPQKEENK